MSLKNDFNKKIVIVNEEVSINGVDGKVDLDKMDYSWFKMIEDDYDFPDFRYCIYFLIGKIPEQKRKNIWPELSKDLRKHISHDLIFKAMVYRCEILVSKEDEKVDLFDEIVYCIRFAIENPFRFYELGIDREDWINEIIWEDVNKKKLNPYIEDNLDLDGLGHKILNFVVKKWYRPRYALGQIKQLRVAQYRDYKKDNENNRGRKRQVDTFDVCLMGFAAVFLSGLVLFFYFGIYKGPTLSDFFFDLQIDKDVFVKSKAGLIPFYVFLLYFFYSNRAVFLPRLFAGIVIGYMFLFASDSIVNFVLAITPLQGALLLGLNLVLSAIFICIEIKRRLENEQGFWTSRIIGLLSLGIIKSILIGLVLNEAFGRLIGNHAIKFESVVSFEGLLGNSLYPKVIILFIPFALLVGIVFQLFWEDKPITEL